jgi:hypothetical protein
MKANDLMIGDWLCATDDDGNKHLCRVASIEYDRTNDRDDYTIDFNGTGYSPEWPDVLFDCEPIPLTPEILEKNGFKNKKGRFMQIGNFDNPPLVMWHLVDDIILGHPKFQLEIHYGGKSMHVSFVCRYAHELQHALRLCGIDKEIKLED